MIQMKTMVTITAVTIMAGKDDKENNDDNKIWEVISL